MIKLKKIVQPKIKTLVFDKNVDQILVLKSSENYQYPSINNLLFHFFSPTIFCVFGILLLELFSVHIFN